MKRNFTSEESKQFHLSDKYTIFEKAGKRMVYNWLQHFSQASLNREFEENDLRVTEVYSDVAGRDFKADATEMAVVARNINE